MRRRAQEMVLSAMADVDVASIFRDNGYYFHYHFLKKQLQETFTGLLPYQDKETHLWKDLPLIDDPKNYLEVSGSLMMAYAAMKGARLGFLPFENMTEGSAIFEGAVHYAFHDSHLGHIVQVSGLDADKRDGSIAYYLSEPVVEDDAKGVGPFMMAYAEYLSMPY